MDNNTSLGISKELQKRLKIISAFTNKKLYQLIEEATDMLEEKYHILHSADNEQHMTSYQEEQHE
jgi:predicted DNA-binding protein